MNRIAKAGIRLNNQTSDLEPMKLDEVIRKYPDGITLNWLDTRTSEDGNDYIVYTFLEEPGRFSNGSGDFLRLWDYVLEEFGGCMSDMQEYLKANPVRVKIWKTKTKSKRTYTKVKIIEDENDDARKICEEAPASAQESGTDAKANG